MIKKTKRGWEVISHKSGRSMGIYSTNAQAQARLSQLKSQQDKFRKMIAARKKK